MRVRAVYVIVVAGLVAAAIAFTSVALPGYYARRLLKKAGIELSSKTYIDAACRDDIGTVMLMLDAGMDVNAKAPNERRSNTETTALYCAAGNSDVKLIDLLIARGAAIEATNSSNETALFAAVSPSFPYFGQRQPGFDAVTELLAKGAKVNAKSDNGTVLHAACRSGNMKLVNFLLDHHADPTITDANGVPPLGVCSANMRMGNEIPFDRLLVKGVNIDAVGTDGNTLLGRAVRTNNTQLVEKLLSLGANANAADAAGDTPLIYAVRNMQMLTLLVEKGADVNHAGRNGTALIAALRDRGIPAAGYLLSKGADPAIADAQGNTALHYAAQYPNTASLINGLITAGASPNAANQEGDTPLHLAVRNHNEEGVNELLANGAQVNLKNYAGQTPLALASASAAFPFPLSALGAVRGIRIENKPNDTKRPLSSLEKALIRHGGKM